MSSQSSDTPDHLNHAVTDSHSEESSVVQKDNEQKISTDVNSHEESAIDPDTSKDVIHSEGKELSLVAHQQNEVITENNSPVHVSSCGEKGDADLPPHVKDTISLETQGDGNGKSECDENKVVPVDDQKQTATEEDTKPQENYHEEGTRILLEQGTSSEVKTPVAPDSDTKPSSHQEIQNDNACSNQKAAEELLAPFAEKLNINDESPKEDSFPHHGDESEPEKVSQQGNSFQEQAYIEVGNNESAISDADSADEAFDDQNASYDDSDEDILPGARRPRRGHSDDEEDDDEDDASAEYGMDDLVYSDHTHEADSHYSDAEDSSEKELEEAETSDPHLKPSTKDADVSESAETAALNQEAELDADQDKTNPAYVPRTGRYFMHDYRDEEEEGASKDNATESKPKKDTRKWQHDRFRYREQAPRSRAELIRKYGYDIRNEENAKEESTDNPTETPEAANDQSLMDDHDQSHESKPAEIHRESDSRRFVDESTSTPRGASRSGTSYRSSHVRHAATIHSHEETRIPTRQLRGRFTVGQRRPNYQPPYRGRSDPVRSHHIGTGDMEVTTEREQSSDHHLGRTNPPNPSGTVRYSDSRNATSRQPQNRRNMDYPSRGAGANYASRRSFTRARNNFPRDNVPYSGPRASGGAQPRYPGPNQVGEKGAARTRDDHRPNEQVPKRYSALRQTNAYPQDSSDTGVPRHQNERQPHRTAHQPPRQYSSRNYSSAISEEPSNYNARQRHNPANDGYGQPLNSTTETMGSMSRPDAHYHSHNTYPLESTAQSYNYEQGPRGDPSAYTRGMYPQMTSVDVYPVSGVEGYSEAVPIHPYLYNAPVDTYPVMPTEHTQHYDNSTANRERRPLLGRRPLRPLVITDPRDHGQSSTTSSVRNTHPKARTPPESWSTTPSTEVIPQDT